MKRRLLGSASVEGNCNERTVLRITVFDIVQSFPVFDAHAVGLLIGPLYLRTV